MPARSGVDLTALVVGARSGDVGAIARLISLVETDSPSLRELSAQLVSQPAYAQVIGLTGPPGVGKSTMAAALVAAQRAEGKRVGVLAVDPSSPLSGGALLGDRVRMPEHTMDAGVFIRSMAARGHLGGLSAVLESHATPAGERSAKSTTGPRAPLPHGGGDAA